MDYQAFPSNSDAEFVGMTIRDYFAAAIVSGCCSYAGLPHSDKQLAEWSYRLADAMLKARNGE